MNGVLLFQIKWWCTYLSWVGKKGMRVYCICYLTGHLHWSVRVTDNYRTIHRHTPWSPYLRGNAQQVIIIIVIYSDNESASVYINIYNLKIFSHWRLPLPSMTIMIDKITTKEKRRMLWTTTKTIKWYYRQWWQKRKKQLIAI